MARLYVNPGGTSFQAALNSRIYVDKTMIIDEINNLVETTDRFVCMVRPRRFGKSYVGSLICAYYSRGCDTRHLFKGLKLQQSPTFEKHLNKLDVIRIDLGGFYSNFYKEGENLMDAVDRKVGEELRKEFPDAVWPDKASLPEMIASIYQQTGHKFVVFIDEYDVLIREKAPACQFEAYLKFLNGLFKDTVTQEAIALAYITGILPIVRDKVQSKLNVFWEYTFLNPGQFAEFMGFTEEETRGLCEKYDMSYDECKQWYDGYQLNEKTNVLAPMPVVQAMSRRQYADYWSQTGAFTAITDVIKYSKLDLTEALLTLLKGESVRVNVRTYQNTMTSFNTPDDVLTFCILLGYLGYDNKTRRCMIPNAEVRQQWELIANGMEGTSVVAQLLKESEELLQWTIEGNAKEIAAGLGRAHDVVATSKGYNDENAFQSAILYAYYYAQNTYTLFKELPTGKGFADVVFIPKYPSLNYPAFVLELKVDQATGTAMQQIESRQYGADLLHYRGNMKLIAVNYDTKTKTHSCEIKEMKVE